MANNVYTLVTIESSKNVIKEFSDKIITPEVEKANWSQKSTIIAENLFKLIYDNYPAEYSREWMAENLGAKWCFVHDWQLDDDTIDLTFDSAWYPPDELFHKLAEYFKQFGDFEMEARSEDEAYQNVSGGYANQNGSEFLVEDEDIPPYPDDEDFDSQEDHDEAIEEFYDKIADMKDELLNECKENLALYP